MRTDLLLVPMGAPYADMRAAALAAEEAGFDGLWTWDHLRDPEGGARSRVPEAWTALAALAEVTQRLVLGPLVLNVASRHPGLLANMAATLQEISEGRLLLGLGAGANRRLPYAVEHEALGLAIEPDRARAARVAEAAQVMRRLWAGDALPAPTTGWSDRVDFSARSLRLPSSSAASARGWRRSRDATATGSTRRPPTRGSPS